MKQKQTFQTYALWKYKKQEVVTELMDNGY